MTSPSAVFAELEGVTKAYPGSSQAAVTQLSLELRPGEVVAMLGPNGAGKTTTVKMIAGLVLPTSGTIRVCGHDIVRERVRGVRHIGAVLEGARNLYWRLSAYENLLYSGTMRMVAGSVLRKRIADMLALLDLTEHRDREVRHFSRGMQQKVAIAAALLHDPDILLLDEPTLGLDVQAARQVEETVNRLAGQQGKSILLTTHVMDLAERLSDRTLVIHKGKSVAFEPTKTLIERHNLQRDTTEIKVGGGLGQQFQTRLQQRFSDLAVTSDNGATVLALPTLQQAEMIRLLQLLDEQDVTIIGVGRRQATLEEVFLSLTGGAAL
jgi:ABC-2 type transport system ATP-binding protein